jgi:hypothetical protein
VTGGAASRCLEGTGRGLPEGYTTLQVPRALVRLRNIRRRAARPVSTCVWGRMGYAMTRPVRRQGSVVSSVAAAGKRAGETQGGERVNNVSWQAKRDDHLLDHFISRPDACSRHSRAGAAHGGGCGQQPPVWVGRRNGCCSRGQRAVDRLCAWRAAIVAGNCPSVRRTRADLSCFESRSVAVGNQVAPPGLHDHLRTGLCAQLRPNVAHVELYRFFGNH